MFIGPFEYHPIEYCYRDAYCEAAFVVDQGRVIHADYGTPINVFLTSPDGFEEGKMFTHNHPNEAPPSNDDIIMAYKLKLSDLRVSSRRVLYSLRPRDGGNFSGSPRRARAVLDATWRRVFHEEPSYSYAPTPKDPVALAALINDAGEEPWCDDGIDEYARYLDSAARRLDLEFRAYPWWRTKPTG